MGEVSTRELMFTATDKLSGAKLLDYVKQRFHQPPPAVLG